MNETTFVALSIVIFGWAILSEWFADRNITGPLVFLIAGLLLANPRWGIVDVHIGSSTVHVLAELTLAMLLFADASAVPLAAARQDLPITVRLLAIGLPLSIVTGTAMPVGAAKSPGPREGAMRADLRGSRWLTLRPPQPTDIVDEQADQHVLGVVVGCRAGGCRGRVRAVGPMISASSNHHARRPADRRACLRRSRAGITSYG